MNAEIAAGFLLVRPVPRPEYADAALLPETIISLSECLCPQFPGTFAIAWCGDSDEIRDEAYAELGVPPPLRAAATAWATDQFESAFGLPNIFYTLKDARAAKERFCADGFWRVIGTSLSAGAASDLLEEAPEQPGEVMPGVVDVLRRRQALPEGGRLLGYEPLVSGLEPNLMPLEHSWLCNGLETHCAEVLNIQPNEYGFLGSFDEARRCCQEISRDEVGAEPGLWLPWSIVLYEEEH